MFCTVNCNIILWVKKNLIVPDCYTLIEDKNCYIIIIIIISVFSFVVACKNASLKYYVSYN